MEATTILTRGALHLQQQNEYVDEVLAVVDDKNARP
jgi:hypothetical protein